MPFLSSNYLDDEQLKKQVDNQGQNISGEGTSFDNQPPGSSSASLKSPKSSGQYTNINEYLNANKEQATDMGNNVAQSVEDKATKAQGDIGSLAAEKPNTAAVDPYKYLADPTNLTDADKSEYSTYKSTGGYSGPDDVTKTTNYQSAYGSANAAQQAVNQSGTEEGRMSLLQNQYSRPNYQRGAQVLDQTLLQNDPTSKQRFADLNQKFSGISSLFNDTATDVGNAINSGKQTALSNKQSINDAETKTWGDLLNPIQARADQANKDNPTLIDKYKVDAANGAFTDEELSKLGLKEGTDIYNLNLQNYLTPNQSQVGLDNVATAEERAKYAALQSLINDPTRTQITSTGKAIDPVTFNSDTFNKDLATRAAEVENTKNGFQFLPVGGYNNIAVSPSGPSGQGYGTSPSYKDADYIAKFLNGTTTDEQLRTLFQQGYIHPGMNLQSAAGMNAARGAIQQLLNQYGTFRTQAGITDKKITKV